MRTLLFPIIQILAHIRAWPLDKQLTLMLPSLIVIVSVISGSWQHIQINDNKAAISALLLFLVLIIVVRSYLKHCQPSLQTRWFFHEFWPVPAILLGYLLMRILRLELAIESFEIPQQDENMITLDQFFFGKTLPLYIQFWVSDVMTFWMETAYLHFYYLLPIGSLVFLFLQQQKEHFILLRQGIIYTLVGGFFCYFIMPVKGPIDFIAHQFTIPLNSNNGAVYAAVNSFRFAYDCFPSLHTAIPWLTLFICGSWYNRWIRLVVIVMVLSITLSTLYLRYHYGIDVIAGFLWACIVAYIIKRQRTFLS